MSLPVVECEPADWMDVVTTFARLQWIDLCVVYTEYIKNTHKIHTEYIQNTKLRSN